MWGILPGLRFRARYMGKRMFLPKLITFAAS